ncbi:unnamed protein product [Owenia fusiformis]|uniref:Uncharacterized protein n=1 Tax=Owenia fusiformis TaxID=6347 RepID=A0A8J1XRF7_OWEFU|nr:unnamed protein product [Owenia fusiformis]
MFAKDYTRPKLTNDAYMKFRVAQTLDFLQPGRPGPSEVIWQPRSNKDFQDEEYEPARVSDRKHMFEKRGGNSGKAMRPKFFDPSGKSSVAQPRYETQYLSTKPTSEHQGVSYVSPAVSTGVKDSSLRRPPPANLKSSPKGTTQRANYDMPTPKPFGKTYVPSQVAIRPVGSTDQFWDQHEQRYKERLQQENYQHQQASPRHAHAQQDDSSDSGDLDEVEGPMVEEAPRYRTLLDQQLSILKSLEERPVSPPGPGLHRPSTYVQRQASKSKAPRQERPRSTHGRPAEQPIYAPNNRNATIRSVHFDPFCMLSPHTSPTSTERTQTIYRPSNHIHPAEPHTAVSEF